MTVVHRSAAFISPYVSGRINSYPIFRPGVKSAFTLDPVNLLTVETFVLINRLGPLSYAEIHFSVIASNCFVQNPRNPPEPFALSTQQSLPSVRWRYLDRASRQFARLN